MFVCIYRFIKGYYQVIKRVEIINKTKTKTSNAFYGIKTSDPSRLDNNAIDVCCRYRQFG